MARSCYILTDYDAVNACHSRSEPVRERSASIELPAGGERFTNSVSRGPARPPRLARDYVLSTIATKLG